MSILEKSLSIIEFLAERPAGLSVSNIAQRVNQPASGVHRTLNELIRLGYVRQVQDQGDYALTMKPASATWRNRFSTGWRRRAAS